MSSRYNAQRILISSMKKVHERDSMMLRNIFEHRLDWLLDEYIAINGIANSRKDNPNHPPPLPKNKLIVNSKLKVKYWSAQQIRDLIQMETQYDRSVIYFRNTALQAKQPMQYYYKIARLFNNDLAQEVLAKDSLKPDKLTQIYVHGYAESQFEEAPQVFIMPLTVNDEPGYTLEIPALSVFPKIMALGISESHPRFAELYKKKISLPIIGKVRFIKCEEGNPAHLTAIIPSHILSHQKYFPDIPPAKLTDFVHPELKTPAKEEEISDYVAQKFQIDIPKYMFTPFIVTRGYKTNIPLTMLEDGKELNLHAFEMENNRVIPFSCKGIAKSLLQSNAVACAYNKNFQEPHIGVPLEKLSFKFQLNSLIVKGIALTNDRKEHSGKVSSDLLRGLLLKENDFETISDTQISAEYSLLNSLCKSLQLFEHYCQQQNVTYHESITDLLEREDYKQHVKPWDKFILYSFFNIENKTTFEVFVFRLAKYRGIVECETDKSEERKQLFEAIYSNMMVRFLYGHLKYYYPTLANFYIGKVNDVKQLPSDPIGYHHTALRGLTTPILEYLDYNNFNHYINYAIEMTDVDYDVKALFNTFSAICAVPRFEDFYSIRRLVITRDPYILENKEILYNAVKIISEPLPLKTLEAQLVINQADQTFLDHNIIAQSVLVAPNSTSVIYYRPIPTNDNVPEYIKDKLAELDFKVAEGISIDDLKKDLMTRLVVDINEKYPGHSQRMVKSRLYEYVVKFVDRLPESFFKLPFHKKCLPEEFKPKYDPELLGLPNIISRAQWTSRAKESNTLNNINEFLQWKIEV